MRWKIAIAGISVAALAILGYAAGAPTAARHAFYHCYTAPDIRNYVTSHVDNKTWWRERLTFNGQAPVTSLVPWSSGHIASLDIWDNDAGLTGFVFYDAAGCIVDANTGAILNDVGEVLWRTMWPSMAVWPSIKKWKTDYRGWRPDAIRL